MDALKEWVMAIFGVIITMSSPSGIYTGIADYIKFTQDEMTVVETFYDYFAPWAYYMLLIYFLMQVVDSMTKDQVTLEIIGKHIIKLVAGILFIQYGKVIISTALSLGNAAVVWTEKNVLQTDDFQYTVSVTDAMMEELGFWGALLMVIPSFFLLFVNAGMIFVLKFQLFARKFEMCLRLSFAPIAFCDIANPQGVIQSNGFKYAKKILALSLQGAAIVGVFAIAINLQLSNVITVIPPNATVVEKCIYSLQIGLDQIVITLCIVGAINTAKQVLNDALVQVH